MYICLAKHQVAIQRNIYKITNDKIKKQQNIFDLFFTASLNFNNTFFSFLITYFVIINLKKYLQFYWLRRCNSGFCSQSGWDLAYSDVYSTLQLKLIGQILNITCSQVNSMSCILFVFCSSKGFQHKLNTQAFNVYTHAYKHTYKTYK